MTLREQIARIVAEELRYSDVKGEGIADRILALPEIAEAQKRIAELELQLDVADGDLRDWT